MSSPRPVRSIDPGSIGSGVRTRELVRVNPWWIVIGRGVWWFTVHPYVSVPTVAGVALGVLFRSVVVAVLGLLALAVLGLAVWIAVACVRGSARGARAIIQGLSRTVRVRRHWPAIAVAVGYGQRRPDGGPSAPPLRRVRMTNTSVEAIAVTGEVVKHASQLEDAAPDIAAGMFCDRVRVKAKNASEALLTFEWGKHLAREYLLHDVPEPSITAGWPRTIAFGVTEDGGPAELVANMSVLIGGVTGSGKSSAAWSIIAGYVKSQIPFRVRVVDPGELEFGALKRVLDQHNADPAKPSICYSYATTPAEVRKTFNDAAGGMHRRKAAMRDRNAALDDEDAEVRVHEPTEDEPLDILVIDELLPYATEIRGKKMDHPVSQLIYMGRKYGYLVVACSQLAKIDIIGDIRDLFPQRICFRTKNRYMTEAVLGENAETDGAKCSKIDIRDAGVCYLEVEGVAGYTAARSAYVPDKETRVLARGEVPLPPTTKDVLSQRRNLKPTVLYRHYDRAGTLLYVGISNHYDNRTAQHTDDKPWWGEVDPERSEVETFPNRDLAETAELLAITQERPLFNYVGNEKNRYRIPWQSMPPGTRWDQVIAQRRQQMRDEGRGKSA